jgi:hypothetical protein
LIKEHPIEEKKKARTMMQETLRCMLEDHDKGLNQVAEQYRKHEAGLEDLK